MAKSESLPSEGESAPGSFEAVTAPNCKLIACLQIGVCNESAALFILFASSQT